MLKGINIDDKIKFANLVTLDRKIILDYLNWPNIIAGVLKRMRETIERTREITV